MHGRLRRLHWVALVMNGRGGTSEIVNFVHLDIEGKGHVVAHQLEAAVADQVLDVAPCPGKEIIHTEDFIAACKQCFAQNRADETRSPRYEDAFIPTHETGLPFRL